MKILVILATLTFSFFSHASELTDVEAAFLAGVEMGAKGEMDIPSYVVGNGHVIVKSKGKNSFSINIYDGYDCGARGVIVKATAESGEATVSGATIDCY